MALLRLEEVASRLGMSYTQTRILVLEGTIPMIKVGARGIRVEEAELEKYIANHRQEAKHGG